MNELFAISSGRRPESPAQRFNAEQNSDAELPEVFNGREVADIASELYSQTHQCVGKHIVESNIVLVLSGLKPSTEAVVTMEQGVTFQDIQVGVAYMNTWCRTHNLKVQFYFTGTPFKLPSAKEVVILHVDNLVGYERISRKTKFDFVPLFQRDNDFTGIQTWKKELANRMSRRQNNNILRKHYDSFAVQGLLHGYPDQAIKDIVDWHQSKAKKAMQQADMPLAEIYSGSSPRYEFYPEHQSDPEIVANLAQVNQILQQFYESDWHQAFKISMETNDLYSQKQAAAA